MTTRAIIHKKLSAVLREALSIMSVSAWSRWTLLAANPFNDKSDKEKTRARVFKLFIYYSVTLVGTSFVFPIEVYQGIKMK